MLQHEQPLDQSSHNLKLLASFEIHLIEMDKVAVMYVHLKTAIRQNNLIRSQ